MVELLLASQFVANLINSENLLTPSTFYVKILESKALDQVSSKYKSTKVSHMSSKLRNNLVVSLSSNQPTQTSRQLTNIGNSLDSKLPVVLKIQDTRYLDRTLSNTNSQATTQHSKLIHKHNTLNQWLMVNQQVNLSIQIRVNIKMHMADNHNIEDE